MGKALIKYESVAPSPRGRGRPAKVDALTPSARAKRYREKQKAAGLSKRYVVTANTGSGTPDAQSDRTALLNARSTRGAFYDDAQSERDFYTSEIDRLNQKNAQLASRMREAEQVNIIKIKELIVLRDALSGLQKSHAQALALLRHHGIADTSPVPSTVRKPRRP